MVTSDVRGAGTDADVSIVIYGKKHCRRALYFSNRRDTRPLLGSPFSGEKGDTGERKLDNHMHNDFERGQVCVSGTHACRPWRKRDLALDDIHPCV